MDIFEAMEKRHSVRKYTDKRIEGDVLAQLKSEIEQCNRESGLNIQLITDEPNAFDGFWAHYGKFTGVRNYIAIIGKKGADLQEKGGYYGERIVLKAQMLGLNTCWVALTFSKSKAAYKIGHGEKLVCVISVGYGETNGVPHVNRSIDPLCKFNGDMPRWFKNGLEASMMAPTATNQQKFRFTLLDDGNVKAEATGGFYSKVDLGIVKYHFELGAGIENFRFV
ncbi:MAG: nitroreductase [Oscillospiraceae bacterium]|nr:nitroreductase [Oscillospiraceae bacterium]